MRALCSLEDASHGGGHTSGSNYRWPNAGKLQFCGSRRTRKRKQKKVLISDSLVVANTINVINEYLVSG